MLAFSSARDQYQPLRPKMSGEYDQPTLFDEWDFEFRTPEQIEQDKRWEEQEKERLEYEEERRRTAPSWNDLDPNKWERRHQDFKRRNPHYTGD